MITKDDKKKASTSKSKPQPSYIPDNSEISEEIAEDQTEVTRKKLLDRAAKLKLQIHDQLMKVLKDIPAYDLKADAFYNADIFESYTDRYNLKDEQRNHIFYLWLPAHYARRLTKSPMIADDGEEIHSDDSDRLRQLLLCTTGEDVPSIETLDSLQTSVNEDPFAFKIKFSKAYKMILGVDDESDSGIIKAFVKKFKYLDPASLAIAQEKDSLSEASSFIDKVRRQMKQGNLKSRIALVQNDTFKRNSQTKDKTGWTASGNYDRCKQVKQREPITCYYCQRPGHLRYQCKKFLRDVQIKDSRNIGKENGLIPLEPSAPPRPNVTQSSSPYAPLIKQIRELSISTGMNEKHLQSTNGDSNALLPTP